MTPHVMQIVYALATGGSETLAGAVATTGVARGLRMSVTGLHHDGPLGPALRARGVETHAIGRRAGFQPRTFARLYGLFRRARVDVVLTHHLGQLFYSAPAARLAGCRLIHVEHEHFSLLAPKARRQLRAAARLAERVVGVSEAVAAFLVDEAGLPARKVTVIRNGVDLERFAPGRGAGRAALGLPAGAPLVGTVGRLDPVKDHATLLAAFRTVRAARPEARLVIVGDGEARADVEAAIEMAGLRASVRLLGERSDVAALLPELDVFVLSSVHEGLALALLEAMACARPVVATDVGAAASVLADPAAGVLVQPRDAEAMARAIARLLDDGAAAAAMGAAARRVVEERYDLRATVDAYLALCRGDGAMRHPVSTPRRATALPGRVRARGGVGGRVGAPHDNR